MFTSSKSLIVMSKFLFIIICILSLIRSFSSGSALLAGVFFALFLRNPFLNFTRKWTPSLLQFSVAGLGAGMNLTIVGQVGARGISYTIIGIGVSIFLGLVLGKYFKSDANTSLLVTVGTAICGGSAIAAVASTIRAQAHQVSVALATVFLLNSAALFIFPEIGHFFSLTEEQFGLWSGLAIHDTSSVVGAALQYGAHSLEIGTTVKLARALWIIPISIIIGIFWGKNNKNASKGVVKRPWFILWFLIAAAIVTWIPELQHLGHQINDRSPKK